MKKVKIKYNKNVRGNLCIKDERGNLYPFEFKKLPFKPKRIFIVSNVPNGTVRGLHAHYKTKQLLICLSGRILVGVNEGKQFNKFIINQGESYLIENGVWDYQQFFNNAILLVLCSTEYDQTDYIENFDDFLKWKNK